MSRPGWRATFVSAAFIMAGLWSREALADPLYSVTDLGVANPSAAYLSGQSQLDSTGNYLPLLSSSQQAAFQAGSFDVYAHPATVNAAGLTFYMESGGDIVQTNFTTDPVPITSPFLVTSNNLGVNSGTGTESNIGNHSETQQVVLLTPDPHTVTDQNSPGAPVTLQSPGYLSVVPAASNNAYQQFIGTVAGINDQKSLAVNEYTYVSASAYVQNPHLLTASGDTALGSLGGAAELPTPSTTPTRSSVGRKSPAARSTLSSTPTESCRTSTC